VSPLFESNLAVFSKAKPTLMSSVAHTTLENGGLFAFNGMKEHFAYVLTRHHIM
jgi:hypothetical protein